MKWLPKLARDLALTVLVLFAGLFIYANWNPPREAHKAKPAYYSAIAFANDCSAETKLQLEKELSRIVGVTAVSVNPQSKMAVVAYNPNDVEDASVFVNTINLISKVNASPKKWEIDPNKPQCPAHGFMAWMDDVKAALCVRKK